MVLWFYGFMLSQWGSYSPTLVYPKVQSDSQVSVCNYFTMSNSAWKHIMGSFFLFLSAWILEMKCFFKISTSAKAGIWQQGRQFL